MTPTGIVEHLRKIHQADKAIRAQAQEYIARFPEWNYNYSTIQLPLDGLAPQPIIPIFDGF
jgi:hypothetical protein